MTPKELNQLYWLRKEIDLLKTKIKELEATYGSKSTINTGLPSSNIISDITGTYAVEIADLKKLLSINLDRCILERKRLENYINSVKDIQMRLILRLRHMDGMTWEIIADELGYTKSGVFRKHQRFLEKCQQIQQGNMV